MAAHDVNPILSYLDQVIYLAPGGAVSGPPAQVVTGETLTRLYRTPIEVLRTSDGQLVVVGRARAGGPAQRPARRLAPCTRPRACCGRGRRRSGELAGPNLIGDVRGLFSFQFMVNAYEAGTIVAVMAALVGWFMVLRRQTFAGHTLSVVAFPGAAAATCSG